MRGFRPGPPCLAASGGVCAPTVPPATGPAWWLFVLRFCALVLALVLVSGSVPTRPGWLRDEPRLSGRGSWSCLVAVWPVLVFDRECEFGCLTDTVAVVDDVEEHVPGVLVVSE